MHHMAVQDGLTPTEFQLRIDAHNDDMILIGRQVDRDVKHARQQAKLRKILPKPKAVYKRRQHRKRSITDKLNEGYRSLTEFFGDSGLTHLQQKRLCRRFIKHTDDDSE